MSIHACKLPLQFDSHRMQKDLDLLMDEKWTPHYKLKEYKKGWSGLALRSSDGAPDNLIPVKGANYLNTIVLLKCDYFKKLLDSFQCKIKRARLMKLDPGGHVYKHIDEAMSLLHGYARIHIPITTNKGVHFLIGKTPVYMQPGEAWYFDATIPHQVYNLGETPRVHLVIDCVVNDWVRKLINVNSVKNNAFEWLKYQYRVYKYVKFQSRRRKLKMVLSRYGLL